MEDFESDPDFVADDDDVFVDTPKDNGKDKAKESKK